MQNLKYWLWLSKVCINEKLKKDLILKYKNPVTIWNLKKQDLERSNINKTDIVEILNEEYKVDLEKYEEYIEKSNIGILTILSKEYPNKLFNIYDSPVVLFYKGDIKLLNKRSLAIIGSRECSEYGRKIATSFSKEISRKDICIISGLAKGIDTFAHMGSYSEIGKTIAVVGTGIDIVYPKENLKLSQGIIKNEGLIISEYIIGQKPEAKNFPKRNRIISALSHGILVIEATKRSGALITVDFAIEHGKEVYAVPGNITSFNSYGTNELIKQGAKLTTNVNDILEDF